MQEYKCVDMTQEAKKICQEMPVSIIKSESSMLDGGCKRKIVMSSLSADGKVINQSEPSISQLSTNRKQVLPGNVVSSLDVPMELQIGPELLATDATLMQTQVGPAWVILAFTAKP